MFISSSFLVHFLRHSLLSILVTLFFSLSLIPLQSQSTVWCHLSQRCLIFDEDKNFYLKRLWVTCNEWFSCQFRKLVRLRLETFQQVTSSGKKLNVSNFLICRSRSGSVGRASWIIIIKVWQNTIEAHVWAAPRIGHLCRPLSYTDSLSVAKRPRHNSMKKISIA